MKPGSHPPARPTPAEARKAQLFRDLGMRTSPWPWADMELTIILTRLRENAGWTLEKMGQQFDPPITRERMRVLESSGDPAHIERLVKILRPRLEELVREGWLFRKTYEVNPARYERIAQACRVLRGNTSRDAFEAQMKEAGLKGFGVRRFEEDPCNYGGRVKARDNLLYVTCELCAFYGCETEEALLKKTEEEAKNPPPLMHLDPAQRLNVRRALAATLEFLGLQKKYLLGPVFPQANDIPAFINRNRALSAERIGQIPAAVIEGYRACYGKEPPEFAHRTTLQAFVEKGMELAAEMKIHVDSAPALAARKHHRETHGLHTIREKARSEEQDAERKR